MKIKDIGKALKKFKEKHWGRDWTEEDEIKANLGYEVKR